MSNLNCNREKEEELHPQNILSQWATEWNTPMGSEAFARKLDENDPLKHFRNEFYFPKLEKLPKGMNLYSMNTIL